ncbi:MAG: flavodoxin family protein, partial [Deltaproteobacteria bacterium]|nr:flavodoxin family protein [Deltaproteobacteria bacterium]
MKIMGILGSPRVNGKCASLLKKALAGAESCGAETKRYDLITCNIRFCRGCGICFSKEPELTIGPCPIKDDMRAILEDYLSVDGFIYACPTYDV